MDNTTQLRIALTAMRNLGVVLNEHDSNALDTLCEYVDAALARESSPVQQAEPIGYVRADELEKLKHPMVAGRGMMLNKSPITDGVALYLSATPPEAQPITDERKAAEFAYTVNAFDYERNPVGSRDWVIFWQAWQARALLSQSPAPEAVRDAERQQLQMAAITTASLGYWKEGDGIHPDYDTVPLHDVAALYAKYEEARKDADRYRWLRSSKALIHYCGKRGHRIGVQLGLLAEFETHDSLDAAIDAAMAKEGSGT